MRINIRHVRTCISVCAFFTPSGLIYYYIAHSRALKEVVKDLRLQLRVVRM